MNSQIFGPLPNKSTARRSWEELGKGRGGWSGNSQVWQDSVHTANFSVSFEKVALYINNRQDLVPASKTLEVELLSRAYLVVDKLKKVSVYGKSMSNQTCLPDLIGLPIVNTNQSLTIIYAPV